MSDSTGRDLLSVAMIIFGGERFRFGSDNGGFVGDIEAE